MARSPKFVGKQLDRVVELIKKNGVNGAMEALASGKLSKKLFPEQPVSVSLPTIYGIAAEAGIKLVRGKPNPVKTRDQKRYVASLVKKMGSLKTVAILASSERNTKLFPHPVSITPPTVCKIAAQQGVKLVRGRPRLKKAA